MKYREMVELTRQGKKCRRTYWKPDEYVWSDGIVLIHTTSYFGEPRNQSLKGYTYICEHVDVCAEDWVAI